MRFFSAIVLSLLLAGPALAQEPAAPSAGGEELVDRVVAVVGDTVLLLSDIQTELQQLQASGRPLPTDPVQRAEFVEQLVRSRVDDLVLLEAARTAGIEVRDQEVNDLVEQELQAKIQEFGGSEAQFVSALSASGLTKEQYRQTIAEQYRNRAMVQRFIQQRSAAAAPVAVTEEEIRDFFEAQRGSLGTRPTTVSFRQAIVPTTPSDSAVAAARREAEDVLQQLREGGDFEVLAKRFSDDPGTKDRGGDLGWFRRGRMVPEFETAVYALRPGQTSGVVETDFGFHIIRLEKARAGERQARHILIRPEVTDADIARARQLADSLAVEVRNGASIAELAQRFETPSQEAEVSRVPVDQLPPAYGTALGDVSEGEIVGPVELEGISGPRWAVVELSGRAEAGAYTLDDLRERIRSRLQEQKTVEQLVEELRGEMYVAVRM
jgi:peptidyl-prolyl cis-trans isomerase SurA